MARFGKSRSRANTDDSNYHDSGGGGEGTTIPGFAESAAAGGVAASMMSSSGGQPPMPPQSQSGSGANAASGHRKQKSITSGISTLFRRQPTPDTMSDDPSLLAVTAPSNKSGGGRDPSGVHATRGRVNSVGDAPGGGGGLRGKFTRRRSKSRGKNNNEQSQQSQSQQQGQYSQAQRDLLQGGGSGAQYDHTTQQQQHQHQSVGIDPSTSGGGGGGVVSGTLSGADSYDGALSTATSLSRELSDQNLRNASSRGRSGSGLHYGQNHPIPSSSYDVSYGGGGDTDTFGRSRSRSETGTEDGMVARNRSRSRSRNRDPHSMTKQREQLRLPRRYRGFSTSISSLFLDESIVCGAFSCCGLLLSSRTEHLLNERNVKRGLTRRGVGGEVGRGKEGGKRTPSRILGVAYVLSILGVLATYAIWGFEDQNEVNEEWYDDYYGYWQNQNENDDGYQNNNDDGGNNNNNNNGNYNNDDANNDNVQYDDDGAYNNNDDANRKLEVNAQEEQMDGGDVVDMYSVDTLSSAVVSEKHHFNGIMKLRDHREYVFEPAVGIASGIASQAYTNIMTIFDDNGLSSTAQLDKQLQGEQPKPFRKLEDQTDSSSSSYDAGQQARTVIIIIFLFLLGVIGRRRRMRTRFAILRSRAQDDHLYYASVLTKNGTGMSGSLATPDNTVMENFHEREDKYDGACSHTLFGCYPVDSMVADYADYNDDIIEDETTVGDESTIGTNARKKKRRGGDFMSRTMTTIFNCCCGKLCQCWCQFFSICALAQEAREARLLLPPIMQRIDLITHQPFHEYAKDVNNVRRRFMEHANRTWVQHYAAMSHLSRYIILGFVFIVAFVVMTMVLHPMGGFDWGDAIVLIATFTQSFLVLMIVFGIFHRSDLSFDAVVKFFAVGFVICVPVGFVMEGILINGFYSLMYLSYYLIHWMAGENFDVWISGNHRGLWMLGELINAYFIAALVEELCKYYGFRFVEHPDLIFLTGLDRSAQQAQGSGGLNSYNYDSQLVSEFSRSCEGDGESVDSRGRRRRSTRRRDKILREEEDEEPELRTLQQQAAAITTGMISVAVGLACAENFLYVFFLGGTGGDIGRISGELAILIFRSIFPVHALSAAMQSINMIRKFIEEKHGGTRNAGVGRIIFPAVLLHGTFDAILMCVNAYIEASWNNYYENGGGDDDASFEMPYNAMVVNLVAALGILGVMAASFGWYSYQNKLQMIRLAGYDMKTREARSERGGFNAPTLV